MRNRFFVTLGLIAVLLGSLSVIGLAGTLDDILSSGELVICTELGNVPWNYQDPATGEVTGFTTELVQMYADSIGVDLVVKSFDWAGVIPALLNNKADMIAAPLSRTMTRSTKILYTEPYIIAPGVVVARKGEFASLDDLNKSGVILTTTSGSIHEEIAIANYPNATMNAVPTVADHNAALVAGRADAVFTGKFVGESTVEGNANLEVLPGFTFMDSFACAVRFDSFDLWTSFNLFMRLIKLDGRYADLYEKWFEVEWVPYNIETAN